MSLLARPLTYDDLRQMPDDGNRYELLGGELIVSPSPNRAHQWLADDLHVLVGNHVRLHRLGKLLSAPVDVRLTPHDVVQPDLLFIRQDRLDIYQPRGDVDGPPDLVVEIASPSTHVVDETRKAQLYASAGVPEYWLVDPEQRRFRLFTLSQGRYEETGPVAGRYQSTVIAGLVLDPAELFASLDEGA